MKILFVIDIFIDGGASNAMIGLIEGLSKFNVESKIFTRDNYSSYNKIEVCIGDGNRLIEFIKINNFDIIHWFRTNFRDLSHSYFKACDKQNFKSPFIFVTLCQVPTSFTLRFTLLELKKYDYFIFICKEAFNHEYHKVIPEEKKSMIYFGTHQIEKIQPKEHVVHDKLIFGRGSTLNKCPNDMIKNYLKITKGISSTFKIAGGGDNTKIIKQINKYNCQNNIELIPHLSPNEWISFLKELDIYLYQLPTDSYSAIDATIQDAMLTEVPVVIFGPNAPKELIINGENGFAASTIKDFIDYSVKLAKDPQLRIKIGQNGRKHIIENFSNSKTISSYYELYNLDLIKLTEKNKIPFNYILRFFIKGIKPILLEKIDILLNKMKIKNANTSI